MVIIQVRVQELINPEHNLLLQVALCPDPFVACGAADCAAAAKEQVTAVISVSKLNK